MTRKRDSEKKAKLQSTTPILQPKTAAFPIIGIGASAGGLEAFEAFFTVMPAQPGMAFVLVQHLQPTNKSILVELVSRFTPMRVLEVEDGIEIQPNHVYIIPPDRELALLHGHLHLFIPQVRQGQRRPIDSFFRSLAVDLHERAIGIILSGTGSDGVLGLQAIAEEGGLVIVQDPQTAQYDGMPSSAIRAGLNDFVLSPAQMPAQLLEYLKYAEGHLLPSDITSSDSVSHPSSGDAMQKIFILLRSQTGHDFSYYKPRTIQRRLERRMIVNQIQQLSDYVRYLQQDPLEIENLFRDLLIGVTHFFRDPEVFTLLREKIIPQLLKDRAFELPIRIWVPGCSTGEEVYSLAMLLREELDRRNETCKVQIFATDINTYAINKARTGIYPDSISADLSAERLQRFFTKENGTFVIKKTLRDMIVFATQNVVDDPPFSKVDLISCRNLLIYLNSDIQKKILPLFYYSLNKNGFLLLGNSETIGEFTNLFTILERKWKLFQRKGLEPKTRVALDIAYSSTRPDLPNVTRTMPTLPVPKPTLRAVAEQELLNHHTPACILINEQCDILYIHGRTGHYLEPAPGEATVNILKMARPGLRMELTTAVRKVLANQAPVQIKGLSVEGDHAVHLVDLIVKPVNEAADMGGLLMVLLKELPTETPLPLEMVAVAPLTDKDTQLVRLERELRTKEEYLQTTIQELESANEALKSTNEEFQSANEELQSTNEEMETAKEELQSVNEELMTVNAELQQKIEEVSRANSDLSNLLAGTQIGTIFLDFDLRVQRFTPAITQVVRLIQSDIGRSIQDIVVNIKYEGLIRDIQQVLDTLIPQEKSVETVDGRWYLLRISPYRTLNNVIEGAVITFVDISEQKKIERLAAVVRDANDAITVFNFDGAILAWNPGAERLYGWREADALTMNIFDMIDEEYRVSIVTLIAQAAQGAMLIPLEIVHKCRDGARVRILLTATALLNANGVVYAVGITEKSLIG